MGERDQASVDAGADAGVADLGVHAVGEVDRARAEWQRDHATLRSEHEDLVLVEVGLETLHELGRIGDFALPVDDAVEPVDVGCLVAGLVRPVGSHSPLGPLVHLARADLDLEWFSTRADHGGVEALVQVELGHRHVVLEAPHDRLPVPVNAAEGRVAILHRIDDHANGDDVEDLVELFALLDHLLVDAPEVLSASGHVGGDVEVVQLTAHIGHGLGQVDVALGAARDHEVVEFGVPLRIERREGQIFELLFEAAHAETVGQRCIDLQSLVGNALLLLEWHRGDGAHVVETIGQLDDENPEVLGHRHQHLAHRRGLLGFLGVELDALELGDTIDDGRDFGTELTIDIGDGDLGVFNRIVKECGGDGGVVETDVGDDLGHGERVVDVPLAALARLALVSDPRDFIGLGHEGGVGLGVPTPVRGKNEKELVVGCALVPPPGQQSGHRRHGASGAIDIRTREVIRSAADRERSGRSTPSIR